jgi:hypothetical protein
MNFEMAELEKDVAITSVLLQGVHVCAYLGKSCFSKAKTFRHSIDGSCIEI